MGRRKHSRKPRALPRKPGAPPGSFALAEGGDVELRAVRFDADHLEEWVVADLADLATLRQPGRAVWLDVRGLESRTIDALVAAFGLHPLAVEDAVHTHQRAKIESYPNHELLIARMITAVDGAPTSEQISFFVGDGFVLTVQEHSGDPFEPIRERLRGGRGQIRKGGASYLAYALLDAIVDHYFPLLEAVGDRIEDLEATITVTPDDDHLADIQELRRTLILFRRAAWPLRDAVASLARGDVAFFDADTRVFLRDTHDHLLRIVELLESYRDLVGGLMDLFLSVTSTRTNEVMRVLTVISTIFIPLTFIAGVYGMNFDPGASSLNMPELRWGLGYPAVMLLMVGIGAALFAFFWRRGWIGRGRRPRVSDPEARS